MEPRSLERRAFADGMTLRVLAVGASIVYGYNSADGNGFRYALRNELVYNGNPVNMIGSVRHALKLTLQNYQSEYYANILKSAGTMADNQVEGWGGFVIDQMYDKVTLDLASKPNLILLHVGTNDMGQNLDYTNAPTRLGALISWIFDHFPGVTVIASTLLPSGNSDTQNRTSYFNSKIPGLIEGLQEAGRNVTYVDFSSSWYSLADIGPDGIHPTTAGYQKMAKTWYDGIAVAAAAGMLKPAAIVPGLSDDDPFETRTCDEAPGNALGPYQIQQGSGVDDGPYVHTGVSVGGFSGFTNPAYVGFNNPLPEGVYWADINGDGIDDYVYVPINSNGGFGVALSLGAGAFGTYLYYAFSISCDRSGVRFADMTGDGRDDFCCISAAGDLDCWQNTPGADSRSPNWVSMGRVKANEGYVQSLVRLADIDGDGRADYCIINNSSATWSIWGWRNGAVANVAPQSWQPLGGVIQGLTPRTLSGYRFVDLNGDHKDDLVWVDENGQVTTWINQRGWATGGWTPVWQYMGVTHGGAGAGNPRNVTFGAFMGSGRADYSTVTLVPNVNFAIQNVYVDRYRNDDHGGVLTKGDGTRYCDMRGSGSDDFIWLSYTGEITVLENNHHWNTSISPWNYIGVVYNANRTRAEVHFADFDGDGKCDILLVDKATGATTVIRNDWVNGVYSFTNIGVVTGNAECTEGYGYDRHDTGVRWSDIDADGRADFLCMGSDGTITGYLNQGIGVMIYQGQIKHTEGKERKDLRLTDVDGDKRDDLVWLDPKTGQMQMWKNMGASLSPIPSVDPNSAFSWVDKGFVATGGVYRGSAVEFGNIYGIGRADYVGIIPQTNQAYVMFNLCPSVGLVAETPNPPAGAPPAPCYPIAGCT